MPLSATKIRNAKPKEKQYKLFDGNGLFLLITPSGGKGWRFKYRFEGKEKLISLGIYPETSLAQARVRSFEARKQVATGINPRRHRKAKKAARASQENTFEIIAREWFGKFEVNWAPGHSGKIKGRLENDVDYHSTYPLFAKLLHARSQSAYSAQSDQSFRRIVTTHSAPK